MSKKAESSKILSVEVSSNYGKTIDLTGGVASLQVFESVLDTSIRCSIDIIDAGVRLMGSAVGGLEEEDLNRTLTKDEFEKLIDPFMRRFADLLKATLAESGKLKNNILQFRVESSAHNFEP